MIDFDFDNRCYGCGACQNACQQNAIKMISNDEGFLMPHIDLSKCINCKACENVCPYVNFTENPSNFENNASFIFHLTDRNELLKSSSGGVFFGLAKRFITDGDYVCGAIFDESFKCKHIVSNKLDDVEKMRGSKYVQSDISDCFIQIENLLKSNKKVLFTGTPCQVASIKLYFNRLRIDDRLYTASVICHGTPSPKVWMKYKEYLENKADSKLKLVSHRTKGKKYLVPLCKYQFANNKEKVEATYLEDIYCYGFAQNLFLRNTCYKCQYKGIGHKADLIIGDYFQSDNRSKNIQGLSTVIVNTQKGNELTAILGIDCKMNSADIMAIINENVNISKSAPENRGRDIFFENIDKCNICDNILNNVDKRNYYLKKYIYKLGLFELFYRLKH